MKLKNMINLLIIIVGLLSCEIQEVDFLPANSDVTNIVDTQSWLGYWIIRDCEDPSQCPAWQIRYKNDVLVADDLSSTSAGRCEYYTITIDNGVISFDNGNRITEWVWYDTDTSRIMERTNTSTVNRLELYQVDLESSLCK